VGVELFGFSHEFYSVADAVDTISSEMLESHLTAIAVEIHTTISCGITVGG
jgi:hypothetical protein